MRVAAGALSEILIKNTEYKKIKIDSAVIQIGSEKVDSLKWDTKLINQNPFFAPNKKIIPIWQKAILDHRKKGSSLGAIIEVRVSNMPVNIGEPIYQKLDSELSKAIMSINAVKGIEFGAGFNIVEQDGLTSSDPMQINKKKINFLSNNSGGILGGISSGQDIVFRYVVKPTSSVLSLKQTISKDKKNTTISTKGRHDPCVGIRAVPVGIAMTAFVLADLIMINHSKKI